MSAQPLRGYHLLVTRPQAQAEPWVKQLTALGAEVSAQPMMMIQALTDNASQRHITNRVLAFDEYHKAIFISQNAVHYGMQWLDRYWPQLPIGIEWFAIGKATSRALENNHQGLVLSVAAGAMNSESLLQLPQLQQLSGQKIVIFRGQGGRDHLAQQLQARGAFVDYCELYQRLSPEPGQGLDPSFRQTSQRPVVSVHSGETLTNLCSILPADDLLWLQQQIILVPGERVAALAQHAGFSQIAIAENASHEGMINALTKWVLHD